MSSSINRLYVASFRLNVSVLEVILFMSKAERFLRLVLERFDVRALIQHDDIGQFLDARHIERGGITARRHFCRFVRQELLKRTVVFFCPVTFGLMRLYAV